jgi:hypothetical protein
VGGTLEETAPVREQAERTVTPVGETPGLVGESAAPVEDTAEPVLNEANETLEPVTRPVEETAGPVLDSAEKTLGPVVEPASETAEPVLGSAGETLEPVVNTAEPVLNRANETLTPVTDTANETLAPVADTANETLAPVLDTANETLAPVADTANGTLAPVLDTAGETLEPVVRPVAETLGSTVGTVPQIASHALEPGGGAPVPAPEPLSVPPVTGAMPATGTSSPAPVAATLGTPRGADGGLAIGLPPSSGREFAATSNASLAWEHPGAFAVAPKAVSSAWSVRGPPAVAAGLSALLIAVAHGLWAETLAPELLSGGLLLDAPNSIASGASAPNGGSAPLPAGPAAPSPAGSSSSGLGASAGGGLGLGLLALLLALSPLSGRLLRYSRDFPRPSSALVLAIERPG